MRSHVTGLTLRSVVAPVLLTSATLLLLAPLATASDNLALDRAAQHFYNLEYDEALAAYTAEAARDPENPDVYNYIAETVLYYEMYRSGALETELVTGTNPFLRRPNLNLAPADEQRFNQSLSRAMELAGGRLKTNPNDAAALYSMGVSYGLRANYYFLVKKSWIEALRDATSARRMHRRATEIDPAFVDARMIQGIYEYVIGSLPITWKMLGFLAGFRGNREEGIRTLKLVTEKGSVNRVNAAIVLCAILRREKRPLDVIPYLDDLIRQFPRSFLFRLELVQMYADAGDGAKALEAVDRIEELKRARAPGYDRLPLEKILYTRANLLFWYGDLDRAIEEMKQVTARTKDLDLNTGVYSWMRLGQLYDLKGQRESAIAAYQEAIRYAPDSDAAKESRTYLRLSYKR